MKKLICENDIRALAGNGEKACRIDADTIITPSARDEAARSGIEFVSEETKTECVSDLANSFSEISPETLNCLVGLLVERGYISKDLLQETKPKKPYTYEKDPAGLKVVRGRSVRMEEFFPGNPKVKYQEVIDKEDSAISSGILVIDHDEYEWTQNYDENDYVLEGTMTVTINGRSYTAQQGDCVFIPKGATVIMGSKCCYCKVFYNTYPSNWADLT